VSRRKLNSAAPKLLSAAKSALKALQRGALTESARLALIAELQDAVQDTEVIEEWKFSFAVTHKTWEHINKAVDEWYVTAQAKSSLRELLQGGHRKTVQRVYCSLDVDVVALKKFQGILRAYDPQGATSRAFDRLIEQMDTEIFNRPALEILAQTGL